MQSPRDAFMATFRREPIERLVFQPRLYYWYYANRVASPDREGWRDPAMVDRMEEGTPRHRGEIPPKFEGMTLLDVYHHYGVSPRYAPEVLAVQLYDMPFDNSEVKITGEASHGAFVTTFETPLGELRQVRRGLTVTERLVKGIEDFEKLKYVVAASGFVFHQDVWDYAVEAFGEDGMPQAYHLRSPMQRIFLDYMAFEHAVDAIYNHPDKVRDLLDFMEAHDDVIYDVLAASPMPVINFGENLDSTYASPMIFEEYLLPYYQRRVSQLQAAGKFCHIHVDGSMKPLVPLLSKTGFDGFEAATPLPQGDVTLEEIREAVGDAILLDGIPAVMFCETYPLDELLEISQRIIDLFSPRLILGASDEVPPDANLDRIPHIKELVDNHTPPAF